MKQKCDVFISEVLGKGLYLFKMFFHFYFLKFSFPYYFQDSLMELWLALNFNVASGSLEFFYLPVFMSQMLGLQYVTSQWFPKCFDRIDQCNYYY